MVLAGTAQLLALGLLGFQGSAQARKISASFPSGSSSISASDTIQVLNISVPVDHFHNDTLYEPHSDETFPLRYWFDDKHYKEGGPVIILAAGETSGEGRIPFLQYGILDILSKATNGIGVILEHRYYGTSFPVPDLTLKNLRFLTTDQALADTAYFAEHVEFPGHEGKNLTAPTTPYIIYGGSYAGAFAAFARKLYPEVFWGAISSSGVTEAIVDYWEYFEAARLYAPGDCAVTTQKLTHVVDNILFHSDDDTKKLLKDAFGLGELGDADFGAAIATGIYGLQSNNWDPDEDDPEFARYCSSVSSDSILYASTRHLVSVVKDLLIAGDYGKEEKALTNRLLNYIGYVRATYKTTCSGQTIPECLAYEEQFGGTALEDYNSVSWAYQVCTQWGYFQTGSGVPKDQLPLISRHVDLEYSSIQCREQFNITELPDVEVINKHGGANFSYPRVAIVDGQADPWRAATPHAIGLPERESTVTEPFLLIEHGVHHWDENGLSPNATSPDLPPKAVAEAQEALVEAVKAWLKEWTKESKRDDFLEI